MPSNKNSDKPRCTGRSFIKKLDADGKPERDADGRFVYERDDEGERRTRPCINFPIDGADVCRAHGGSAPQVRAKAAVRAEVAAFALEGLNPDDPGKTLLQFMQVAKNRALLYMQELEQHIDGSETLHKAVVAEAWGEFGQTGEYIRGLVQLEAQERDRAAGLALKAIAAGLAKRQVELAEREAEMVIGAVNAALEAAGVPADQRGPAKIAAARHLRLVS